MEMPAQEPKCRGCPERGIGRWDPLQAQKPWEGDEFWQGNVGALRGSILTGSVLGPHRQQMEHRTRVNLAFMEATVSG